MQPLYTLKDSKGLGRYCRLQFSLRSSRMPIKGGACIAVSEAKANIVYTGAKPVAIANCLEFWKSSTTEEFVRFCACICKVWAMRVFQFETRPVTGGNVSFA